MEELYDAVVLTTKGKFEAQDYKVRTSLDSAKSFVRDVAATRVVRFWEIYKHEEDVPFLSGTGENLP